MSPTSTSDDADAGWRHRFARRWRSPLLRGAAGDLLVYFLTTLALALAFATPLAVQYQRDQVYGPQLVQLVFQPCEAERWNEARVKQVLARQGELRTSRTPEGEPVPRFMNVWMLPPDGDEDSAHEPGVLGYFEVHPHVGQRPHIDGAALVEAAGCPLTEIRVTPLASLGGGMRPLPERLMVPLTALALCAAGLASLLAWWTRGRRLPALPAPMPLRRALVLAVLGGLALQALSTSALLGLRQAGLALEPSNLAPLVSLLQEQPLLAVLLVVGVAPLGEELFFRHVLLRRFALAARPVAGLLVSGAIFGVLHELGGGGGSGWAHAAMAAIYVAMGLAFGAFYLHTRRFAAVALAHATTNAAALALLAYPAS